LAEAVELLKSVILGLHELRHEMACSHEPKPRGSLDRGDEAHADAASSHKVTNAPFRRVVQSHHADRGEFVPSSALSTVPLRPESERTSTEA
jgi:hypothetical protein